MLDLIREMDPDGISWAALKPISEHGQDPECLYRVWLRRVIPVIDWARTSIYETWGVDDQTGQYNGMKWVRYDDDAAIRDDAPASARLCRAPHYRGQNLYSAAFVAELKKRNMPKDENFWSISASMPF
jgi:hypothetical protein